MMEISKAKQILDKAMRGKGITATEAWLEEDAAVALASGTNCSGGSPSLLNRFIAFYTAKLRIPDFCPPAKAR